MDTFLRITAVVVITTILTLVLGKQGKDFAQLLTVAACILVFLSAIAFLEPVLSFAKELISLGNLQTEMLEILLKVSGIGVICQIAVMICEDGGNKSLGKALQILTTVIMLWMVIPLLEQMLLLMKDILEAA